MKFEESAFERLMKLSSNALCSNAKLDIANKIVKCKASGSTMYAEYVLNYCMRYNQDCKDFQGYVKSTESQPEQIDTKLTEYESDLDFYDTSSYSQSTMHDVYSTMLNPWCGNAPAEYSEFFYAAQSKNAILHKLNCLICALKQSNNSYVQNIEYFNADDMCKAPSVFLNNIRIKVDEWL